MKIGLGHLRLSPDAFWRMSLPEFFAACSGYLEARGVRSDVGAGAPTREEIDELMATLDGQGNAIDGAR